MIKRVVKMSFLPEKCDDFIALFEEVKQHIRNREGCLRLELLREVEDSNIFFTYSFWNSEEDLNNYRHSDLFKATWIKTKAMFNDRPQAWSLDSLVSLEENEN